MLKADLGLVVNGRKERRFYWNFPWMSVVGRRGSAVMFPDDFVGGVLNQAFGDGVDEHWSVVDEAEVVVLMCCEIVFEEFIDGAVW
jgi:hypothetical protein